MKKIIFIVLCISMILIFTGCTAEKPKKKIKESEYFSKIYTSIPTDNPYKRINEDNAKSMIENSSGIIYLGTNDEAGNKIVKEIYDISKDKGLNSIYYIEKYDDSSDFGKFIKEKTNTENINPIVLFILNGEVIDYQNNEYEDLNNELKEKINKIYGEGCHIGC